MLTNRSPFVAIMFVLSVLSSLFVLPSQADAQTVTIAGKLVDRVCSVEDAYQLQPSSEKRCTLWVESAFACPGGTCACPGGTCAQVFTVYCPNKAVDGRAFNGAYEVCSDPAALQVRHPTKTYVIKAYARTIAQQADGNGQFTGFQFQY